MPSQAVLLAFEPHEWELLTRLPARVMIAAISADAGSDHHTVAEGLAGLNAIAAGAVSASDLVRAAVAAIYAEADPDPPTAEQFRDRQAGVAEVLVGCRAAALVLDARASSADAEAYRQWVESIAEQVCEQEFLSDLVDALRNT